MIRIALMISVSIGSGNCSVPPDKKPLPEPILTKFYDVNVSDIRFCSTFV